MGGTGFSPLVTVDLQYGLARSTKRLVQWRRGHEKALIMDTVFCAVAHLLLLLLLCDLGGEFRNPRSTLIFAERWHRQTGRTAPRGCCPTEIAGSAGSCCPRFGDTRQVIACEMLCCDNRCKGKRTHPVHCIGAAQCAMVVELRDLTSMQHTSSSWQDVLPTLAHKVLCYDAQIHETE